MHAVVGVLGDDTDPMVTVMKLDKAPQETYADIGGLDTQIQEIKVEWLTNTKHIYDERPFLSLNIFNFSVKCL